MLRVLRELIGLLNANQRKRLWILQILIILMALSEVIGVASIAPFMAMVADNSLIEGDGLLAKVYLFSGIDSANWFIFWLGVFTLSALTAATCISIFTTWRILLFVHGVGAEMSDRLYTYYLHQSWLFHTSTTSAQLTKQITMETGRVIYGVLLPFTQINAKLVVSIFMCTTLFVYQPIVAIAGLMIFSLSYWLLYKLVKVRLYQNGKKISQMHINRYRLINDGLGGIKDTLLLNRQHNFIQSFSKTNTIAARSLAVNDVISNAPRYFMELIAFGSAILLVLFLIKANTQSLSLVIPILSVYALAGLKLLPAFQQMYASISTIQGNMSAVESIKEDMCNSQQKNAQVNIKACDILVPNKTIVLNKVSFSYPQQSQSALQNLNITIGAKQTVGVVGTSGSGKSTLIDILLGLIQPDTGTMLIDDIEIDDNNRRAWQHTIGFVSQTIFLSEGSIAENVAFGLSADEMNIDQVNQALQLAHLYDFVYTLPEGVHTQVGERGVKLSGGQRQRIGIARALYQNAQVLIFDEATSALDGVTEKMVMNAVYEFGGKKTIVLVAHRLKTVQQCDVIFLMDKGQVVDSGDYQSLLNRNPQFAKMAQHA